MLLLNWELFNPNDTSGKNAAEIEDYKLKTGWLRREYGPLGAVRIVSTQMANDLKGAPIPMVLFPLVAKDGMAEWAYTENMGNVRKTRDGNTTLWRKSMQMAHGQLMIDVEKDIDLLFFITQKSPLYRAGQIRIDDAREAEAKKVKNEKNAIKLKAAIYGDSSPLSSEATLRQVAHALGITGADKSGENALRIKLEAFIETENKKHEPRAMTTDNFLDFINAGESVIKRGIVGKAVSRKLIDYSTMHGWHWAETKETIVRVSPTRVGDKFAFLCEFYTNEANKAAWEMLLRSLAESGYFEDDQPYEEIKYLAKSLGMKVSQTNKTELASKVADALKVTA